MVEHHRGAGARRQAQKMHQSVVRAVRDQNLPRRGRQAAPPIAGRHRFTQRLHPRRLVTVTRQVRRQPLQRPHVGRMHIGIGRQDGGGQVDQAAPVRLRRFMTRRRSGRKAGARGGALPARQEPVVAQVPVGGRDGRAAQAQRLGQFPFAGQPRRQGQSAIQNQQSYRPRQLSIGCASTRRPPGAEMACQGNKTDRPRRHEARMA